jgi:predicted DNA-binding transcriptional regulator AlpA
MKESNVSIADTPKPNRLISRRHLAERADVSERTIDRMRRAGIAPPEVTVGRQIRFREDIADSWILTLAAGGQTNG